MNQRTLWEEMYPWDDAPHPKRVSIYIWEKGKFDVRRTTQDLSTIRREITVGHIALETFDGDSLDTKSDRAEDKKVGIYVSFNPGQTVNARNFVKTFEGKLHTYTQDYETNYFLKPKRIDLYTLDPTKIQKAFKALKEQRDLKIWLLFGSSIISPLLNIIGFNNSNCCGITYCLLREGGADFRTHHYATDFLYPLLIFYNSIDLLRKFIHYYNYPEYRSYALAQDGPEIIEESYDYLLSGILIDFALKVAGKYLLWSATDILSLLSYAEWGKPDSRTLYNPITKAYDKISYTRSSLAIGTLITLIWFIIYHGTRTPKNIQQFAHYLNRLEQGEVNFFLSNFSDINPQSNKKWLIFGTNRDFASNVLAVIYFLACSYREYVYINDKNSGSNNFAKISSSLFNALIRMVFYRISSNHRPTHVSLLLASMLYSTIIKFSFAQKFLRFVPTVPYLTKVNMLIDAYLNRNTSTPSTYAINKTNGYLVNVFRASKKLMISLPLIPPIIVSLFFLADQLAAKIENEYNSQSTKSVADIQPQNGQNQAWCTFFGSKRILTTTLKYSPLVIGAYLAISTLRATETIKPTETLSLPKP